MIELIVRDTETGAEMVVKEVDYGWRPDTRVIHDPFLVIDIERCVIDLEVDREMDERWEKQP